MIPPSLLMHLEEKLYRQIRRKLLTEPLASGRALSSRRLAEEFDAPRAAVRKVLERLELEGLVEKRPQSGTYPRSLSATELQGLYDAREGIEAQTVRLACARRTDADLDRIDALQSRVEAILQPIGVDPDAVIDTAELSDVDQAFHRTLVVAAGNAWLLRYFDEVVVLSRLFAVSADSTAMRSLRARAITYLEHRRILDAVRAADADTAETAMRRHISEAGQLVVTYARQAEAAATPTPTVA